MEDLLSSCTVDIVNLYLLVYVLYFRDRFRVGSPLLLLSFVPVSVTNRATVLRFTSPRHVSDAEACPAAATGAVWGGKVRFPSTHFP